MFPDSTVGEGEKLFFMVERLETNLKVVRELVSGQTTLEFGLSHARDASFRIEAWLKPFWSTSRLVCVIWLGWQDRLLWASHFGTEVSPRAFWGSIAKQFGCSCEPSLFVANMRQFLNASLQKIVVDLFTRGPEQILIDVSVSLAIMSKHCHFVSGRACQPKADVRRVIAKMLDCTLSLHDFRANDSSAVQYSWVAMVMAITQPARMCLRISVGWFAD